MKMVPMFCLVAAFAAPLHAQVCSGGAGGGIDATGNQCSDASTVGAHENASNIASSGPTAKMNGNQQSTAATVVTRLPTKVSGVSGAPAASTVSAQGASRFAKAAPPPSAPVKTSKIETVDASSCAGGPDGGMDATGNQCAESTVAGMNIGRIVVAKP